MLFKGVANPFLHALYSLNPMTHQTLFLRDIGSITQENLENVSKNSMFTLTTSIYW